MRHFLPFAALLACAVYLSAQTETLLEQADAAFREGDLEGSASLARRMLARNPSAVHAHMILGVIAARQQNWSVSNEHFQSVVRLEPENPHGYFYLGQASLYQQRWEAAIGYFSKALERQYPRKERLLVEMALAQNEAGRPEQALASLSGIDPEDDLAAQYWAVTAFAHDRLNRTGSAIEAIRRALQFDDSDAHSWEFLIGALIKMDEAPQALAEAIRAQKKFPDHPDIQFLFALASYYVTESPLSKLALRNLREAEPDSPRVLLAEGLLYRKQGKTDEATRAFERSAARGVRDARLLLGIVYKENGQYEAAELEYREAERLNPRNGQVLLELGKLSLTRGELEKARVRLEQAAKYMQDAPTVHYQLGLLYRRLGNTEKAQQHFQKSKQAVTEQ
jgi:tetratricopeptide (TPR) repeat protein